MLLQRAILRSTAAARTRPRATLPGAARISFERQMEQWLSSDAAQISEPEFLSIAMESLDNLAEALEELEDDIVDFDLVNSDGVMTMYLGDHGTWVINKQTPNRQLWCSSPISGPKRYNLAADQMSWVNTRDGSDLYELIQNEIRETCGIEVRLERM